MTDKEIIKAETDNRREYVKRIVNAVNYKGCNDHEDVWSILWEYQKENLDTINRQKAEIEALIAGQETLQKYIAEQKAEIESLKKNPTIPKAGFLNLLCGAVVYTETLEEYNKFRKQIKATARAEAIKEFAERLKGQIHIEKDKCLYFEKIDNLVKEMVGEG